MRHPWWRGACAVAVATSMLRCVAQQPTTTSSPTAAQTCAAEAAQRSIAKGDFKEAEAELRQSLAVAFPCPEEHFLLGYALLRQNRAKESLAEYTAAARLRTPAASDLRSVALDYVLLNDYQDAERWIRRALQIDTKDSESWYVLGRISYSTGKFQNAADAFIRVLTLEPTSVKAEVNLGLAYEGLNQVDKAIEAYRKAISFGDAAGKPSEQPLIDLAIVLEHRSDLEGARDLLGRAILLAPDDGRARENLGHVYLDLGELPQASEQLEKAVTLSPRDSRLHYLLGQIYRRQGLTEKAKSEFARSAVLTGAHSTPDYVK